MTQDPAPLLSVKQAAAYLGVTERSIRRWIKDERLRASKLPSNEYRIRQDALDALLTG